MAQVVHLLKAAPDTLAAATMRGQVEAGDRVIVVLLEGAAAAAEGAAAAAEGAGTTVRRVPADLDYAQLVDLVFGSDQVIAW
ncbi:MAG: hypothetical protein HYU51_05830 [Candidatus Rokubacteria bacterium]|nr:hypothetical protein [Candidatus Rokubacteria bacterium]